MHAEVDHVHPRQKRRFFSCLVDGACAEVAGGNGRRQAWGGLRLEDVAI